MLRLKKVNHVDVSFDIAIDCTWVVIGHSTSLCVNEIDVQMLAVVMNGSYKAKAADSEN
jgi:hypothetical protein